MSTAYHSRSPEAGFVRREYDRSALAVPAIVTVDDQDYSARILNIAPGGAMIECSASLPRDSSFLLRCGSIAANADVVWEKSGQFGIKFRSPLSERQVTEQLSRNDAIASRKLLKRKSGTA